jgi:hypothetical protein
MTLMGLSLGGCVSPAKITWSADARSPDGQWVAVAHTEEISGFGTGAVGTFVDLKPINGDSVEVLAFDDGGQDLALKMKWLSPSHLEVLFSDDPRLLYFQVVRTSGIEISVRDETRKRRPDSEFPPPGWTLDLNRKPVHQKH